MKPTTMLLIAAGVVAVYLLLKNARVIGTVGGVGVNLGIGDKPPGTYSDSTAQIIAASLSGGSSVIDSLGKAFTGSSG